MAVDTFTPSDHVGDVIGDLNRRRGMIKSQDAGITGVRIKSDVPLSEMFGYIGDLRTMTSGRGQFSMEFSHYMPCPKNVADEVIKEVNERNAKKGSVSLNKKGRVVLLLGLFFVCYFLLNIGLRSPCDLKCYFSSRELHCHTM